MLEGDWELKEVALLQNCRHNFLCSNKVLLLPLKLLLWDHDTDLAPAGLAGHARPSYWQILALHTRKYILHKIKMIIINLGKQLGGHNERFLSEWKKMSFPWEDIFNFYQKLPNSSQSLTRIATTQICCLHHPPSALHPVTTKGSKEQVLWPVLQSHIWPAALPSAPALPSGTLYCVPAYRVDKAANHHTASS